MISMKNISKAYDKIIFSDFSLDINDGEITAILGPSGCGKTTLLNILLGLDNEYSGNVDYDYKKVISAVFQEDRLIEHLTVSDNLMAVSEDGKTNKKIVCDLGLEEAYNKKIHTLSGGMKRRVALARAMAYGGDVFIFDEPFKGIDLALKKEIMIRTKKILDNKTCIFVTHSIDEAAEFADRIIILSGCPVVLIEDINEVKGRKSSELAEYIAKIQLNQKAE